MVIDAVVDAAALGAYYQRDEIVAAVAELLVVSAAILAAVGLAVASSSA